MPIIYWKKTLFCYKYYFNIYNIDTVVIIWGG